MAYAINTICANESTAVSSHHLYHGVRNPWNGLNVFAMEYVAGGLSVYVIVCSG